MNEPTRRVAVRGPGTRAVRRAPGRPAITALDEQDVVGDLLIRSLVRAQLVLGLRLAAVFGCLIGGLPLLFAVAPSTRRVEVLGIALPWLVLGGLVYPAMLAGGWLYVRLAERNERDFVDLVERS